MEYYVTQLAFSRGILVLEGEEDETCKNKMIRTRKGCFYKPHWHVDIEEAECRVKEMVGKKISQLERLAKRLSTKEYLETLLVVTKSKKSGRLQLDGPMVDRA